MTLGITELVLRDGHQSLLATRMRIDDMLPACAALDDVGYWSIESWGGATFDACIRYLGEDPWERMRQLKQAMPKTPQQMLLRGQNLLGYRHYADDVVDKFVEKAADAGVDIFRVFDALNDVRNLSRALAAVRRVGKHAQGTMSYTTSRVHTLDYWLTLAKAIVDLGVDSLCIKDMAGILTPYTAFELVRALKNTVDVPIHMQCHATAGLSSMTILKAVEAGIDNVDTSISPMSMTYGHSPTEAIVATLAGTQYDTGIDLAQLAPIAAHFRDVRKRYVRFEGALRGVDARILTAQVPGGMLTNMENQLKEQRAADKLSQVMEEMVRVREDLGWIPLVTPTSQIVGTQAVVNVLSGQRYKTMTKETTAILRGEYGQTPAPVNADLQKRALAGDALLTERPADRLPNEWASLQDNLRAAAKDGGWTPRDVDEETLIIALFPQVGLKFLQNRDNPDAFEPPPSAEMDVPSPAKHAHKQAVATYTVTVDGERFVVRVGDTGDGTDAQDDGQSVTDDTSSRHNSSPAHVIHAPLAGTILRLACAVGQRVGVDDVVIVLEAMKMETEIVSTTTGHIKRILVKPGDAVTTGQPLVELR